MDEEATGKQSRGNVFADLGFPAPDEELAKADLAFDIYQAIHQRGLSAKAVAHALRVRETVAAQLVNAEPVDCPLPCLTQYLAHLSGLPISADSQGELAAA